MYIAIKKNMRIDFFYQGEEVPGTVIPRFWATRGL